jgi:SAM-dependent methyltransferase
MCSAHQPLPMPERHLVTGDRTARALKRLGRYLPGTAGGFLQQLGRYTSADKTSLPPTELADKLSALGAVDGGGDTAAALARSNEQFAAWVASHSYDAFAEELQALALLHTFRGLEQSAYARRHIDFSLIVDWYAAFRRVGVPRVLWDIAQVQDNARGLRFWRKLTADESDLSAGSLTRYYNSIPFPGTCGLLRLWNPSWLVSRVYPLLLARQVAPTPSFFDYGGSTGLLTSIASSMGYARVALIDDYDAGLQFAKWRDTLLDRRGIDYLRPDAVPSYAANQQFDVGCCHQVLEHLSDMQPCLQQLSLLVRKGGLLFLSTGFHLYPHPGHLRSNIEYRGREAELLAPFGFSPIALNLVPFKLQGFLHIFRKTSG